MIVFSVDPGFNYMGYSIGEYTSGDAPYVVWESGSFSASKELVRVESMKPHRKHFSTVILNSYVVKDFIEEMIAKYKPDYCVSEDTFYNPRRPKAYVSLILFLNAVERTLYELYREEKIDHYDQAKLYRLPPLSVKKVASDTVGGKSSKEDMLEALKRQVKCGNIEIGTDNTSDLEGMSEHEIDAIFVGYAFCKIWLPILEGKLLPSDSHVLSKAVRRVLKSKKYKTRYLNI